MEYFILYAVAMVAALFWFKRRWTKRREAEEQARTKAKEAKRMAELQEQRIRAANRAVDARAYSFPKARHAPSRYESHASVSRQSSQDDGPGFMTGYMAASLMADHSYAAPSVSSFSSGGGGNYGGGGASSSWESSSSCDSSSSSSSDSSSSSSDSSSCSSSD